LSLRESIMKWAGLAFAIWAAGVSLPAWATDAVSDWGFISWISTGWVVDSMAVITTAPLANPGCQVTDAGYATNPDDPGHQLHHAVLMMAFAMNRQVQIRASDCVYDKPRIISVSVR
jgi:hypothetical protein